MKLECPVPHLQHEWEFKEIINFYNARADEIKNVLEIGSFYGGTLYYWMQNCNLENITSVDWPVGPNDGRYTEMLESRKKWDSWVPNGAKLNNIIGNSHDESIIRAAKLTHPKNDIDWLVIDGDHMEAGVQADWDNFSPLVREGGWIAFHDSVGIADVARVVAKLKGKYPFTEISAQVGGWGWIIFQKI